MATDVFTESLAETQAADIEDLSQAVTSNKENCCSPLVAPERNAREAKFNGSSFVPGTQKIFIKTWGCSHNRSDSEYMAGILAKAGYEITENSSIADLWLLNSCTVKTPSEDQLRNYVNKAVCGTPNDSAIGMDNSKVPVVLAGCVPQAAPKMQWIQGFSVVGTQQIDRVVDVVEETLKGNTMRLTGTKRAGGRRLGGAALDLPKIRRNPSIEVLAINSGCLNHCTYCKTKKARGDLASYTIQELVDRAQHSFTEGVHELWLTSEDLGAFGRDLGVVLPDLLNELVKVIPDGCMMRLGMTNPPYILDHLEEIAQILCHPRVYSFLHVPVQAGSDAVLGEMKREYTNAQFRQVVDYMLEHVPDVHIATDFICAFPTETEHDFEESMQLLKDYHFKSVFINQFYPRPGTPAAKLHKVDPQEAKRRTKCMSDYFRGYHPYEGREGRIYKALITEWASDGKHLVAHNKSYEQILIAPPEGLPKTAFMNRTVNVQITQCSKYSMVGDLIDKGTGMDSEDMKVTVANKDADWLEDEDGTVGIDAVNEVEDTMPVHRTVYYERAQMCLCAIGVALLAVLVWIMI